MSSRRPPLHTCAISFFAIAHKTSLKAQELDGPIRTMVERIVMLGTFFSPIFSAAQHLFLATLLFIDRHLLACEDIIGRLFPPSNYAFNKIDQLVHCTETLPDKSDPFLHWALLHVIVCLNFLLPGFVTKKTEDNDVVSDINYTNRNEESTTHLRNVNEEIDAEAKSELCNESEEIDGKDVSYQSDSTFQTVSTEVSDREDAMDGLAKEMVEKGIGKQSLAEEWYEAGWAVKPKQAPKRKQKSKKKK